jgi:hypothetical protein
MTSWRGAFSMYLYLSPNNVFVTRRRVTVILTAQCPQIPQKEKKELNMDVSL